MNTLEDFILSLISRKMQTQTCCLVDQLYLRLHFCPLTLTFLRHKYLYPFINDSETVTLTIFIQEGKIRKAVEIKMKAVLQVAELDHSSVGKIKILESENSLFAIFSQGQTFWTFAV